MNTGVVSVRYAKALLAYAKAKGKADEVSLEVKRLSENFIRMPELQHALVNPILTAAQKLELLQEAAGGKGVSEELVRFFRLVLDGRRESYLPFMAVSYSRLYLEDKGIIMGKLVTAAPSEGLVEKIKRLGHTDEGTTLVLDTKVDPRLIGGFILQVEDRRLDASVASQLKSVEQQFIAKNRRIV